MDAILNQTDVLCVYVAVGQKNSTVAEMLAATCTVYDDLTFHLGRVMGLGAQCWGSADSRPSGGFNLWWVARPSSKKRHVTENSSKARRSGCTTSKTTTRLVCFMNLGAVVAHLAVRCEKRAVL